MKGQKVARFQIVFLNEVNSIFAYMLESLGSIENISYLDLKAKLMQIAKANLDEKENLIGRDLFNGFLRYEYLKNIDFKFQEHLANLDSLREAVYLRSYANKNPITEYKEEGFSIFSELIKDIKVSTIRRVLQLKLDSNSSDFKSTKKSRNVKPIHKELSGIVINENKSASNVQVVRSSPKIGRNEPCYCGSGKKYKNCHGKS